MINYTRISLFSLIYTINLFNALYTYDFHTQIFLIIYIIKSDNQRAKNYIIHGKQNDN